jgi:hypothetical protein
MFRTDNIIRKHILKLIEWKFFEYFILALIIVNSVVLAAYDYHDRDSMKTNN